MNLDIIIGNPPYNNDLYLDFVQAGYQALKPDGVMVMITPAKWQAKGGKKNELFREQIVPHMKEIVYYKDSKDVFDIGLSGGLSIFSAYAEKLFDEKNITIVNGANHENVVMPFVGTLDINDAEIALLHKIVGSKIKRTNKLILKMSFICVRIDGSTHTNANKLAHIEQKGSGVFFRDSKFNVEINKSYLTRPEELGYYHLLSNVWVDYVPRVDVYSTNEVSTDNNFCIYKTDSIDEIESVKSYLSVS